MSVARDDAHNAVGKPLLLQGPQSRFGVLSNSPMLGGGKSIAPHHDNSAPTHNLNRTNTICTVNRHLGSILSFKVPWKEQLHLIPLGGVFFNLLEVVKYYINTTSLQKWKKHIHNQCHAEESWAKYHNWISNERPWLDSKGFFFSLLQKVTCCKSEPVLPLHFAYSEETFLYQETLEFKV